MRGVDAVYQRSFPMSKKDEYFTMMESQIKKWDAEVDKLRAKGDQMSAEARIKYNEQIMAMRASRDAANKKLQEMRTASESAWQNMEAGMDSAWASMKNALDKATSQFKK
jgi:glycerol-3-phosphate O-acyltransferase